jgi:hyperosmotically inducible periplasmic protein
MMPRNRTSRLLSLALIICPVFVISCQSRDADRLAALGSRLGEQAQALLTPASSPLRGLQSVPLRIGELSLDARVSARLKWDKLLAEAEIQVNGVGDSVVELTGTVKDMEQRQRAVEIAQTTVGVEKVMEKLEIKE